MRHGDSSVVGISSPSHRHQTLRIFDLSPWTDICLQKPDTIFQIGITVHRSSRGGRDTIDHSISIILDTSVVGFLCLFDFVTSRSTRGHVADLRLKFTYLLLLARAETARPMPCMM